LLVVGALETLYSLGALEEKGNLSALGKRMASFPIDPIFSKILIESQKHECTSEILSILSMLSIDPVFYAPRDKREEAGEAKKIFASFDGDHLTLLNVLKAFQKEKGNSEWCREHFISERSMKQIMVCFFLVFFRKKKLFLIFIKGYKKATNRFL
jgi:HrpA-like RNA helicase